VAQRADLQQEISTTLRPFYCQLCDKQFKNVVQYDEHTNSYAHHHKARAKDMQASLKLKQDQASINLRKEKERLREERTLRKMAKAAGVKTGSSIIPAAMRPPIVGMIQPEIPPEPKKSGWSKVGGGFAPALQASANDTPERYGNSSLTRPTSPPPPPDDNPPPPPPPG
jgi:hypothetical protein